MSKNLTAGEAKLPRLSALIDWSNPPTAISKENISEAVWGSRLKTIAKSGQDIQIARGGGGVADGGGGDAILCSDGKFYSLDFVQTLTHQQNLADEVLKAKSAEEILAFIAKNLDTKLPKLAASLRDFAKFNENVFDQSTNRVWTAGVNPLFDLKDEANFRVPVNCLRDDGQMNVFQAVLRRAPKQIEYDYDSEVLSALEATAPYQLSFLYIHEWLRDLTQDPITIQKINRILHGKDWLNATSEQLTNVFKGRGAPLSGNLSMTPADVKDENELARKYAQTEKYQKTASQIYDRAVDAMCPENGPAQKQVYDQAYDKLGKLALMAKNLADDMPTSDKQFLALAKAKDIEKLESDLHYRWTKVCLYGER